MSSSGRSRRLTEGTSGRIVELLRHGAMTIDELALALDLTRTAIRTQLTALISRGVVVQRSARKGPTKPAHVFAITPAAEQQLSRAYVPVLSQLLQVLSLRMSSEELALLMGEVGRGLGPRHRPGGSLRQRVDAANQLLRDLGGLTTVTEERDRFMILGQGCPLAAATAGFPEACNVISSLLVEAIGQPVTTCCHQFGRKRCCFEIAQGAA